MTQPFDEQRYRNVLARWRMLAQRRLADLTRQYESGRWKRYFSEPEILHLLQDAKMSVDIWLKISPPSEDARAGAASEGAGAPARPAQAQSSGLPAIAA